MDIFQQIQQKIIEYMSNLDEDKFFKDKQKNKPFFNKNHEIEAYYRFKKFGILTFGSCKPQSLELVKQVCAKKLKTAYNSSSKTAESGQKTLEIVVRAFNAFADVKFDSTPENSYADVVWKWDAVLEYESKLYPVQVKSSLDDIYQCCVQLKTDLCSYVQEAAEIHTMYCQKEASIRSKYGYSTNESKAIYNLNQKKTRDLKKLQSILDIRVKSIPMFIWSCDDEQSGEEIIRVLANLFSSEGKLEEVTQQALLNYNKSKPRDPNEIKFEVLSLIQEKCILTIDLIHKLNIVIERNLSTHKVMELIITRKRIERLMISFQNYLAEVENILIDLNLILKCNLNQNQLKNDNDFDFLLEHEEKLLKSKRNKSNPDPYLPFQLDSENHPKAKPHIKLYQAPLHLQSVQENLKDLTKTNTEESIQEYGKILMADISKNIEQICVEFSKLSKTHSRFRESKSIVGSKCRGMLMQNMGILDSRL